MESPLLLVLIVIESSLRRIIIQGWKEFWDKDGKVKKQSQLKKKKKSIGEFGITTYHSTCIHFIHAIVTSEAMFLLTNVVMSFLTIMTVMISWNIQMSNAFLGPRSILQRNRLSPLFSTVQSKSNEKTIKSDEVDTYGAGQITVLEGLEPVRKRPGM